MKRLLQLLLFATLSFAAAEGYSDRGTLENLYEKILKPNYEKIAPLHDYARKRQTSYIISAILALLVFVLFVKYFKAFGALVAILMIAGGVWYLRTQTPVISPYKAKFAELILTPIAEHCCGYRYLPGKIAKADIDAGKLFSPRIKHFTAQEGLFVKKGVKAGYVEIEFDTKENASVERFAENIFRGFVIILDRPHQGNGAIVSEGFKEKVADIDPEFSAFFSDLPRRGKEEGFLLFGDVAENIVDRCHRFADREIALAMTKQKSYIFWYRDRDPLDPDLYGRFDLKSAEGYASLFKEIDTLVQNCP